MNTVLKTAVSRVEDPTRFKRFADRVVTGKAAMLSKGFPKRGVRFLYGPRESLVSPNGNVILGINPGDEKTPTDRLFSPKTAYYSETWTTSDYQELVRTFFIATFTIAGSLDWKQSWDRSVTSNFFPFRAPGLNALTNEELKAYRSFGISLWNDIFTEITPRCIITFGKPTRVAVMSIVETLGWRPQSLKTYNAKGDTVAELFRIDNVTGEGRVLTAPHYAHGNGVRSASGLRMMADDLSGFISL